MSTNTIRPKNPRWTLLLIVIAMAWTTSFGTGTSHASPIGVITIMLVPSINKIHPPQNLFVDIVISGLWSGGKDNILGAWSMDVFYDPTLFVPLLIPPAGFGGRLGDVLLGEAVGGVDTATPCTATQCAVGLFLVSLLSEFELDALQRNASGSFVLATLGFFASGASGFSAPFTMLGTGNIVLADAFGNPPSDVNGVPLHVQNPSLSIGVPEPGTLALLAAGMMAMLALRMRWSRESRGGRGAGRCGAMDGRA